jgi:hypothetical protein
MYRSVVAETLAKSASPGFKFAYRKFGENKPM